MSDLPEGRIPIKWRDMPVADKPRGHPSTERLEIEKLQARVAELEAALNRVIDEYDGQMWGPALHNIETARAALNPPQEQG